MVPEKAISLISIQNAEMENEAVLTQPFLHRYFNTLSKIFTNARERIHELEGMCSASAEFQNFAIDCSKSNRLAQFEKIKTLSLKEARFLLRAEMLRSEQSEKRIEALSRRTLQLEQRLAITETAELHWSDLIKTMEEQLMKLLDEFATLEKQRIERAMELKQRNEKLERSTVENTALNQNLNAQLEDEKAAACSLKRELQEFQRCNKSLKCEMNSLQETIKSQKLELEKLRGKLSHAEKQWEESEARGRNLKERLNDAEAETSRIKGSLAKTEAQLMKERALADEKFAEMGRDYNKKLDKALNVWITEYENDAHAASEDFKKIITKLQNDLTRVKKQRNQLAEKVYDSRINSERYKQQIFMEAEERLTNSCQKAVIEFRATSSNTQPCERGERQFRPETPKQQMVLTNTNTIEGCFMRTQPIAPLKMKAGNRQK